MVRREELHRDRAAAVAARRARRARADWIRAQLDQLRGVGQDQLRALRGEINSITLSIQQVTISYNNIVVGHMSRQNYVVIKIGLTLVCRNERRKLFHSIIIDDNKSLLTENYNRIRPFS